MPHALLLNLFAGINHINSNHINLFASSKYAIPMGLSAGIIHVVSGADHLVAMAPSSITSPKSALKNGLSWGLGHSSGIIILSVIAIFIRDIIPLERFSSFAEFLVGISLLFIGIFGLLILFLAILMGENILGEYGEKGLTLLGSIIVAFSHFKNLKICKELDCDCHS